MDIFCAPRRDGENASEFVRMLLKFAYSSLFGGEMPEISKTPDGKPYFASRPDICFSLSHTDGFVPKVKSQYTQISIFLSDSP